VINFDFSRVVKGEQAAPKSVQTGGVEGYIKDTLGRPVKGATIDIKMTNWPPNFKVTNPEVLGLTTSDTQSGRYAISSLPVQCSFLITARKEGYKGGTLTISMNELKPGVSAPDKNITIEAEIGPGWGKIQGTVKDAVTRASIAKEASLTIDSGLNTVTIKTDANGEYRVTLEAGDYLLQATATGYQTGSRTVTVVANTATSGVDLYLLPEGATPPTGPGWER